MWRENAVYYMEKQNRFGDALGLPIDLIALYDKLFFSGKAFH